MKKLAQLLTMFQLTRPVKFEDCDEGHEVLALKDKTIIRADKESYQNDMPDLLSMAKLAEIDPLLCTLFFDPEHTEHENRCCSAFFRICRPLQVAWSYKIMRRTAPSLYEKEISELIALYRQLNNASTGIHIYDIQSNKNDEICLYAAVAENPENTITLRLITDEKNRHDWQSYIAALEEFIHAEPQAELFCRLAEAANAPYSARIVTDATGFRFFKLTATERS